METLNERFFWLRLGTLLVGGLATLLSFSMGGGPVGWPVAAASITAFAGVVFFHRRLDRARERFQAALRLARSQAARMGLDWPGIPPALPVAVPPGHPFGGDLDLTGPRSLHHLIDTAISLGGSRRLLGWLLAPSPDLQRILARQAMLAEILPLAGFRAHLALAGSLAAPVSAGRWDGEKLSGWLETEPEERPLRRKLFLLAGLALLNILLFLLNLLGLLPALWPASLLVYAMAYMGMFREYAELFEEAYELGSSLDHLAAVLVYLEDYPYRKGSALSALCEPFWGAGQRPSRQISRVRRVVSAASLRGNPTIWLPLNALVPWDMYFANRLSEAKRDLRTLLPLWLERWYELEALNSLANFAYLNPGYVFPELAPVEEQGSPVFATRSLGHPLIPYEARVSNDFRIGRMGEIAMISGSNMSGKSTFLRTLGVNLCLAFAGGPVAAASLRTIPFRLFTCIHVSDSLSDGISYFYAEVRRLKALLVEFEREDLFPLFFLIDEIFRGTNNRERAAGSRAYVRALVGGHGVGAISTHDLELVHLAEELPGIRNYHFREEVEGDRMVFDYRLRTGPSPTTNALTIMRLEGLPV